MTPREQAARLLALRVVKDWVASEERDLRGSVTDALVVGERVPGVLDPDDPGSLLGFVQKIKGRESWVVMDSAAFLDWCERVAPTEVVSVKKVRESFIAAVVADCKSQGGWISPDGELLHPDGMEVRAGEPTITVKPTAEADGLIRQAIASRRLELGPVS